MLAAKAQARAQKEKAMKKLATFLLLTAAAAAVYGSEKPKIEGVYAGIHYVAKQERVGAVTFLLEFKSGLVIDGAFEDDEVRYSSSDVLTGEDADALHALGAQSRPWHELEDRFGSFLALLMGFREGDKPEFNSATMTTENIFGTSWCSLIGQQVTADFDMYGTNFHVSHKLECGGNGCYGRCGIGCGLPPDWAVQRITQQCDIHDWCAQYNGGWWFGECEDEYWDAARGYETLPDCENAKGVWNIPVSGSTPIQGTAKLLETHGGLSGKITSTTGTCKGTYAIVAGTHYGWPYTLYGKLITDPKPPKCCKNFSVTSGNIVCNSAGGYYADDCDGFGAWHMDRQFSGDDSVASSN
jgi:hypothetical protein